VNKNLQSISYKLWKKVVDDEKYLGGMKKKKKRISYIVTKPILEQKHFDELACQVDSRETFS